MALGVLCTLGKEPESLSDGCLIGFSDLELMSGLDCVPVVFFLRQPNTGEINKVVRRVRRLLLQWSTSLKRHARNHPRRVDL